MKKTTWTSDFLNQLGDDISQFGINVTWSRLKLSPDDQVVINGETFTFIGAMMKAVTEANGMTVTHARRAIEDILAMALRSDRPTDEWAKALFKHGAHWRCAQGWTEKQMRKLLDQVETSSSAMAEQWKNFALNDDQAIAMDKSIAYYQGVEAKAAKKGQAPTMTSPSLFTGSFNWPFAKN